MNKKHTQRLSLITVVVLVVMLGIVTGLTLSVSTNHGVAFADGSAGELGNEVTGIVLDINGYHPTVKLNGSQFTLRDSADENDYYLEFVYGGDSPSAINATFTKTPDPSAVEAYRSSADNFTDDLEGIPTNVGSYRKYWYDTNNGNEVLGWVEFEIKPQSVLIMTSAGPFNYTGIPVDFNAIIDPGDPCIADFDPVVNWTGGVTPQNPGVYTYSISLALKDGGNKTIDDLPNYCPSIVDGTITIDKRQLNVSFAASVPYTGEPQCVVTVEYNAEGFETPELIATYMPLDVVYTKMNTSVLEYNSETGYDEWVEHSEAGSGYTVGIDIIEEYRNRFYIDDGGNEVYSYQSIQTIEKANIPNSVLSLGGASGFGSTFQIGENNAWPLGDDILDRIVVAIESIPGYNQGGVPYIHNDATWEWATGLYDNDTAAMYGSWDAIGTFNPNTAAANIGNQFTIRVEVDANNNTNYQTSYVYLPVTVGKVKTFIRPVTGTLTYNGTAQQPEATIYQYKISDGTTVYPGIVVVNSTVSQTNVGTYDMVVGFNGNYGDTYEFVADEGARFTIQPATLTPSISIDNLDPDAIVYGKAVVISREGVGEEDMLGPGEGIKATQGVYDSVEYRYQPVGGAWSGWADLIDEATQLKNVGEYELRYNFTCTGVEVSGDYYVNYVSAGADTVSFTIVKKDLDVTAEDKETVYGSAAPAFSVNYDGFEYYEDESVLGGTLKFECDYDIEDPYNRDAIVYDITPKGLTSSNYNIIYTEASLTVSRKPLTITANDHTITYGQAPENFGVDYSGWAYTDSSSDLTGNLSYAYNYTQYGDVGDYTITPSGLSNSNYSIDFVAGTLHVEQLEVVIEWSGIEGFTVVYDGQLHEMVATITNILNGDEVATSLSEYRAKNAGAHTAVVDELTGAKAGNYKLPSAAVNKSHAWSITQAPLKITAENKSVTFSDAAPTYTVTYDGFVGGQDASVLSGELAFTCTYAVGSSVGDYPITPSGLANDNYNINFVAGTLTVNKMTITITPNANQKKTYGDDDPTLNYIHSETYNSQELEFTGALGRVAGENAGTYAITLGTLALTDAAVNQNYELELAAAPVNFTIDKRTLAFNWTSEFVYNGLSQRPLVESVEGLKNGHVWGTDIDISWTTGATIDVGMRPDLPFTFTGEQAGNYTHASFTTSLNITRRPLTVAWYLDGNPVTTGASVVYSGTEHVLTAVAGNTCGGDVTLQLGGRVNYTNALEDMNASVTAKEYTANGDSNANYMIESGLANREFVWTISQKEVTLIWANYDLVYNGQSQKPTATVNPTSLVPADSELQLTVTVTGGQICSNAKAGFAYNAEANTLSGTGASNYKFAQSTLTHTFTIAQKEVGFDWEDLELVYNKTAQLPTAIATGLEGSDECLVTVTGAKTYVGEYVAEITGLTGEDALNYKLPESGLEKEYSIVPKVLTVTFDNPGFTYNGEEHAPTIILTGIEAGDDVEAVFKDGYGVQIYAGDYTEIVGALDGSDADNYALPDDEADRSIVFGIVKRQIKLSTILDEPLVVTYGDSIPNMPSHYVQVDPSSMFDFLGDPSDVITVTVAQYNDLNQLVPIMDLSDVGDVGNYWLYVINNDEDNYDIVTLFDNVTDKLVISPKEVYFGWSGGMFDYDGQPHNPSIIVYGLETGDECEVTLTDAVVNAGNYTAIALEPATRTTSSRQTRQTEKSNSTSPRVSSNLLGITIHSPMTVKSIAFLQQSPTLSQETKSALGPTVGQ